MKSTLLAIIGVGFVIVSGQSVEVQAADGLTASQAHSIRDGLVAARACFKPDVTPTSMISCNASVNSFDRTSGNEDQLYFSLGANFYSSFAFDMMVKEVSKLPTTPANSLSSLKVSALEAYDYWNGQCAILHVSDEQLANALAPDPEHVRPILTTIQGLRPEMERVRKGQ